MKYVIIAFTLLIFLLILNHLDKKYCKEYNVVKFKRKERYFVLYTEENITIISRTLSYGKTIACGVPNDGILISFIVFNSG